MRSPVGSMRAVAWTTLSLCSTCLAADMVNAAVGPQRLATEPFDLGTLSQTGLGLVVVVALIGAAVWLTRRLGSSQWMGSGALKLVAGLPLGVRERVVLIQAEDIRLLVGITPGRIETLYVFRQPADKSGTETVPNFNGPLVAALKRQSTP